MKNSFLLIIVFLFGTVFSGVEPAYSLSEDRWLDQTPYGVFFNDYDPNFYTGFVPRVQERERIKIHLGRGNQLRVRMVLSEPGIDNYLADQVARHDLYKEVIDRKIIKLTSNKAWETYHERILKEDLHGLLEKSKNMDPDRRRQLNLEAMNRLAPGRLFHIQKNFRDMASDFFHALQQIKNWTGLEEKLDLVNAFFPYRIVLTGLSQQQESDLDALRQVALSGDFESFLRPATAFFNNVTEGIYPIRDGNLDFYEFTAIYPAGTHDSTTSYNGTTIPQYTTTGVWPLIPRDHGKGFLGMVDYISSAGYYGLMPMLPYEYGGAGYYNAIHNTGISNWIAGHPLLPESWKNYTENSRNNKPYNRVALTSRGPVSHGCTRLSSGHLTELREMLPSTSDGMRGIIHYRNLSHCYDVFDIHGDGNLQVMGVQYYFAFRHTESRVAKQIWVQNNRKDFYNWLYGKDMVFDADGGVTFTQIYAGKFIGKKAVQGATYRNIRLYEAPYEPEYLQFYVIPTADKLSQEGMAFNREMRRVGYGYTTDRKKLFME